MKHSKFSKAAMKYKGKKMGSLRDRKRKPRRNPLWKLDDGISYSILSKFDVDPHRFHLDYVQGWKPTGVNFPIEFGQIFHHLTEASDMGFTDDKLESICNNYVNKRITKGDITEAEANNFLFVGKISFITFKNYRAHWQQNPSIIHNDNPVYQKDFSWLGREVKFKVPYELPNGIKVFLRGKKDGRFDPMNGQRPWLLETKTKGTISEHVIRTSLHKDLQVGLYAVADQIEHGEYPEGVLYNVVRRTQMKPRKGETPQEFGDRLEKDILSRPSYYFMRHAHIFTDYQLEAFITRQLNPSIFKLVTWWNSIKDDPMNPFITRDAEGNEVPNLHHYERGFGQYDSMAHGKGEFYEIICNNEYRSYEQKEHAFPELEEEDDLDQYLVGL